MEIVSHIVAFNHNCQNCKFVGHVSHLVHVTRGYRYKLPTVEYSPESKTTDYTTRQLEQHNSDLRTLGNIELEKHFLAPI